MKNPFIWKRSDQKCHKLSEILSLYNIVCIFTVYFSQMAIKARHCSEIRCAMLTCVWFFACMDSSMFLQSKKVSRFLFESFLMKGPQQTNKSGFRRKAFPQTSQANGFFTVPEWYSMCLSRLLLSRNIFSHCLHLNSYSVCVIECAFRIFFVLNLKNTTRMVWVEIIFGIEKQIECTPIRKYHIYMVAARNVLSPYGSIETVLCWEVCHIVHKCDFLCLSAGGGK